MELNPYVDSAEGHLRSTVRRFLHFFDELHVQHLHGSKEVFNVAQEALCLQQGAHLYKEQPCTFRMFTDLVSSDGKSTKWCEHVEKSPLFYLQAHTSDVIVDEFNHYQLKLACNRIRLYVLLPTTITSPKWLRRHFTLLQVEAEVDWNGAGIPRFMEFLVPVNQMLSAKDQCLEVWMSKDVFVKGTSLDTLFIGGTGGGGDFFEFPYILAFEADENVFEDEGNVEIDESMDFSLLPRSPSMKSPGFLCQHSLRGTHKLSDSSEILVKWNLDRLDRIVKRWVRNPSEDTRFEQELLLVVAFSPRPLSCVSAILQILDGIIQKREEWKLLMQESYDRFHSLHRMMLFQLEEFADVRRMRALQKLIEPEVPREPETRSLLQSISPWEVAFVTRDTEFTNSSAVLTYVTQRWRGTAYALLSSCPNPNELHLLSPTSIYAVLLHWGFAEPTTEIILKVVSKFFHYTVMTSRVFFDSPRGRWLLHCITELFFLVTFEIVVYYPEWTFTRDVQWALMLFYAGNIYDSYLVLNAKHGGNIRNYLKDRFPWNIINFPLNLTLVSLTMLRLVDGYNQTVTFSSDGVDWVQVALASCAIFVWFRALGAVIVPVSRSVAAQLTVVFRMIIDIAAFLFPLLVFMLGFSTFFTAVFNQYGISDFSNSYMSLLSLFDAMLGNYNFGDFMDQPEMPLSLQIYGIIMLVLYLILTGILMLNLLIAIMTSRYDPLQFESEARYKMAEIQEQYMIQVKHSLICSPFNLVDLVLRLVLYPASSRPKARFLDFYRKWLLPGLDGHGLPHDRLLRLPTGRSELPHLFFLLTLYPAMSLIMLILFTIYSPLAIAYFALAGGYTWFSAMQYKNIIETRMEDMKREQNQQDQGKQPMAVRSSRRARNKLRMGSSKVAPEIVPTAEPPAVKAGTAPPSRPQSAYDPSKRGGSHLATIAEDVLRAGTPVPNERAAGPSFVKARRTLQLDEDGIPLEPEEANSPTAQDAGAISDFERAGSEDATRLREVAELEVKADLESRVTKGLLMVAVRAVLLLPMLLLGALLYIVILGFGCLFLWGSLYVWGAKLVFCFRNLLRPLFKREEAVKEDESEEGMAALLSPVEVLQALSTSDLAEHGPFLRVAYEALNEVEPEEGLGASALMGIDRNNLAKSLQLIKRHLVDREGLRASAVSLPESALKEAEEDQVSKALAEQLHRIEGQIGNLVKDLDVSNEELNKLVRKLSRQSSAHGHGNQSNSGTKSHQPNIKQQSRYLAPLTSIGGTARESPHLPETASNPSSPYGQASASRLETSLPCTPPS